jgi:mono/diheme cytochrome c family protein
MRRLAPFLVLAFLLAGCGSKEIVAPTAETVVGTVAAAKQQAVGDAKAGATLFTAQGCVGCHVFKPANSKGNIGPDLDKLAQYAKTANQGSLQEFTHESIANPSAYIEKGYPNAMPNFGQTLSDKQIADLVAYLTKNQG